MLIVMDEAGKKSVSKRLAVCCWLEAKMSTFTRRGRGKHVRKISVSGVKRVAGRSSKVEGADDVVNMLRKEVESLRLELARSLDVSRVNESSWHAGNESSASSAHQVSHMRGASSYVDMVSVDMTNSLMNAKE
ncbi:hypothetical protein M514_04526 [Trichuris suis]|uniref:Uncharacterized protein n=1 Tax=Trichuris suis TaxID=68888 RepID=A0A085NIH3_9BILA